MRTERDKLTDLDEAIEAAFQHQLRTITEVLFKMGKFETFEQAKEYASEVLFELNLIDTDMILSQFALWLACRLRPPCDDAYWQHTLELLGNAVAEGWRLSRTHAPEGSACWLDSTIIPLLIKMEITRHLDEN